VSAGNIHAVLTERYWYVNRSAGLYRPLTTFSYLVNYAVWGNGMRPQGYHAVNLLLHSANVALVYVLGLYIFGGAVPAFALGALWGVHPLLTEAVTNIVGRADLLATFGVLTGFLCYIRFVRGSGRSRAAWLGALAAAQAFGLFSKESAAVLPGLMLLYDVIGPQHECWRRKLPAYGAVVMPFILFFFSRGGLSSHMVIDFTENPLVGAGFWTARMTAIGVIGKYFWLFLWPARLSADYSYNAVPVFGWTFVNWEDARALLALSVCAAVTIGAAVLMWRKRNSAKMLLLFMGFFLITLAPTSNLITLIGTIMAERFLYLPSVGLAGCLVALAVMLERRWKRAVATKVVWAAMVCICLALAGRTYARNFEWHDDLAFWTAAADASSQSSRAHYNLGRELERVPGRLSDAIAEYETALRIQPDHADAHNNLGSCLARAGRLPEAVAEYQAALRIRPDHSDAHNNLGNALASVPGRLPEAIAQFHAALAFAPDHPKAHSNLADALAQDPERLQEAVAEYQAALRLAPDRADLLNGMANALARMPGRLADAIAAYQAALRLQPGHAEAHFNLANALVRAPGRLPDAIAEYEAALRLEPDFAEAHINLGNALAMVPGRLADAATQYQAALRSDPNLLAARVNLSNVLARFPAGRQRGTH
jgi:protein O-mannosyl-transferase